MTLENFKVNGQQELIRYAERLIRYRVGGFLQTSHLSDGDPTPGSPRASEGKI